MSTPETLGRYEILGELGKGAMGIVYLARDPLIGRQLALKTFRLGYSAGDQELEQFRTRFLREAQSAGILSHPNIVTIHDVAVEPGGDFFIAMEYVQGTDLKLVTQRQGRFDPKFAVEVVAQIADGLGYAHSKGVVHRDIKPANIIITADKQAKITDFGIARVEASNLTMEGQLLGTPNYMAPEQIQGKEVDHRADIFSLGVMLYELLTGKKPFAAENLSAVTHRIVYEPFPPLEKHAPGLPDALTTVLDRALAKDPAERYDRGAEMASDLRAVYSPQTGEVPVVKRGGSFLDDASKPAARASPGTGPVPAAAPAAAASTSTATLRAAPLPATGTAATPAAAAKTPIAGRVGAALVAIVALGVVGFGIFKLMSNDAEVPQVADPELERRQQYQPLVDEGRQLLEAGQAEAALQLFERALILAPDDRDMSRWRDEAESQVLRPAAGDADVPQLLEAARAALGRRDYADASRLAEDVLAIDPAHQEGKRLLAEADEGQRRRQEIRTRLRNPAPSTRPSSTPPTAPPVAAPPPPAAVAAATLVVDLHSEVSEGRLTIFNGQTRIYQEAFKFVTGTDGIFSRQRETSGSLRESLSLTSGNLDLRIYVWRKDAQTRSAELKGSLPPGGSRVLKIEVSGEGRVKAALE